MEKYKHIIVPVDGSENGDRALEHAALLAQNYGSELTLVYVGNIVSAISNFNQTPLTGGYVSEQIASDMEETGKTVLQNLVARVPADVIVKTVFEIGSPGPAILAVANHAQADLIVMGCRGLGPVKGILMGSVSSYILSHSHCPVLIVK